MKSYNTLMKHTVLEAFAGLGASETTSEETYQFLETFVCKLYSNKHYDNITQLRYDLTKQKFTLSGSQLLSDTKGVDMSLLDPCRSKCKRHVQQSNYQTFDCRMNDNIVSIDWFKSKLKNRLEVEIYIIDSCGIRLTLKKSC